MIREQVRKHDRICMIIIAILAVVLVSYMAITTIRGNERKEQEMLPLQEQTTQKVTIIHPTEPESTTTAPTEPTEPEETEPDRYAIFDCMSEDWGSEDVEGFVFYELPEKYQETGYLPEKMQIYIRCICKQYDAPYALVLAMIEYESEYVFDAVGDDGNSIGYMQIYEKWHTDRMERLGVNDLKNPYQNVLVGVDLISYLLEKYGTVQDALAAYNYGERGAREHLWNNGIYVYSYNRQIMQRMKEIEEVVGDEV